MGGNNLSAEQFLDEPQLSAEDYLDEKSVAPDIKPAAPTLTDQVLQGAGESRSAMGDALGMLGRGVKKMFSPTPEEEAADAAMTPEQRDSQSQALRLAGMGIRVHQNPKTGMYGVGELPNAGEPAPYIARTMPSGLHTALAGEFIKQMNEKEAALGRKQTFDEMMQNTASWGAEARQAAMAHPEVVAQIRAKALEQPEFTSAAEALEDAKRAQAMVEKGQSSLVTQAAMAALMATGIGEGAKAGSPLLPHLARLAVGLGGMELYNKIAGQKPEEAARILSEFGAQHGQPEVAAALGTLLIYGPPIAAGMGAEKAFTSKVIPARFMRGAPDLPTEDITARTAVSTPRKALPAPEEPPMVLPVEEPPVATTPEPTAPGDAEYNKYLDEVHPPSEPTPEDLAPKAAAPTPTEIVPAAPAEVQAAPAAVAPSSELELPHDIEESLKGYLSPATETLLDGYIYDNKGLQSLGSALDGEDAHYDALQENLKRAGFGDEVTLYRGRPASKRGSPKSGYLNASTSEGTAEAFRKARGIKAKDWTVDEIKVKTSDIVGIGHPEEGEVIFRVGKKAAEEAAAKAPAVEAPAEAPVVAPEPTPAPPAEPVSPVVEASAQTVQAPTPAPATAEAFLDQPVAAKTVKKAKAVVKAKPVEALTEPPVEMTKAEQRAWLKKAEKSGKIERKLGGQQHADVTELPSEKVNPALRRGKIEKKLTGKKLPGRQEAPGLTKSSMFAGEAGNTTSEDIVPGKGQMSDVKDLEKKVRETAEERGEDPDKAVERLHQHLKAMGQEGDVVYLHAGVDPRPAIRLAAKKAQNLLGNRFAKHELEQFGPQLKGLIYQAASSRDAGRVLSSVWSDEVLKGLTKVEEASLVRVFYDEGGHAIIDNAQADIATAEQDLAKINAMPDDQQKQLALANHVDNLRLSKWILKNFNPQLLLEPGERDFLLSNPKIAEAYKKHATVVAPKLEEMRKKMGVSLRKTGEGEAHLSMVRANDPEVSSKRARITRKGPRRGYSGLKPSAYAGRATGSGESYLLDYKESIAQQLGADLRNHARNEIIKLIDTQSRTGGWAKEIVGDGSDASDWSAIVNGKAVPTVIRTFGDRRFSIPEALDNALTDLETRQEMGNLKLGLRKVGGFVTGVTLAAPIETTSHGWRVFSQLSRIPAFGESGARNIVESIPFLRSLSVGQRLFEMNLDSKYTKDLIDGLARHGAIPARAYQDYTSWVQSIPVVGKPVDKAFDVYRELVFGPRGLDIRARVLAAQSYAALHPDATWAELSDFVNQFGLYTRGLQGDVTRFLKDTNLSPFAAFKLSAIPAEIRSLGGSAGMGGDAKARGMQILRSTLAALVTFAFINKMVSGHWPWENQIGHEFDLDLGKKQNGKPIYIPGATMDPGFRALRITGIKQGIQAARKGEDVPAAIASQVGDSILREVASGPPVDLFRRLFAGLVPPPIFGAPKVGVSQEDQFKENLKASFIHLNPIIEASIAKNGYNQTREAIEKSVPGISGVVAGTIAESIFPALAVAGNKEKRNTAGRFGVRPGPVKEIKIPYVAGLTQREHDAMNDAFHRIMQAEPKDRGKMMLEESKRFRGPARVAVYKNIRAHIKAVD